MINEIIEDLNKKLIDKDNLRLGLLDGKMGVCIYFYELFHINKNKEYEIIGSKLLNDVITSLIDYSDGRNKMELPGIGLGIDYLIKRKYIRGDINKILEDIDSILFKEIVYRIDKNHPEYYMHIIYYFYRRLCEQKEESDKKFLFEEVIIKTLNDLYENFTIEFYNEPLSYTIYYYLPLFLYILSKLYELKFYNYRITKIVEEFSPIVLSKIPTQHGNKLFLLWGMGYLLKNIKISTWQKHAEYIHKCIDINVILTEELRNKEVYLSDGLSSIYFLIKDINQNLDYKINYDVNLIYKKVKTTEVWEILINDSDYFNKRGNLFFGFCGLALTYELLKRDVNLKSIR